MFLLFFMIFCFVSFSNNDSFIKIAHRGNSNDFPENSKSALIDAIGKSDYVEQDLQVTKDDMLIVFHDRYLNDVTNVKEIYKDRKRKDGKYYVVDFTYDEIKKLTITKRHFNAGIININLQKNRKYRKSSNNSIISFEEILQEIKKYNDENKKEIGIYPELKDIWFYKKENKDMSILLLEALKNNGYQNHKNVIIQSFDTTELKRLKFELFDEYGMNYKIAQLIGKSNTQKIFNNGSIEEIDVKYLKTKEGLKEVKKYANIIAIDKRLIIGNKNNDKYLNDIKELNLLVHVYTFNLENVNKHFDDFMTEYKYYKNKLKVNGIFTDFLNF